MYTKLTQDFLWVANIIGYGGYSPLVLFFYKCNVERIIVIGDQFQLPNCGWGKLKLEEGNSGHSSHYV